MIQSKYLPILGIAKIIFSKMGRVMVGFENAKNEAYTRQRKYPQRSLLLINEQRKILVNAVDDYL
jgi:hypothetical protein